jgi:hypothetical protein
MTRASMAGREGEGRVLPDMDRMMVSRADKLK